MKLWHVAQWGNKEEGGNGWDNQCIVRANHMDDAIDRAEKSFYALGWIEGKASVICLIGDDGTDGKGPDMIIPPWTKPAFNLGKYPAWFRDFHSNEWVSQQKRYGDEEGENQISFPFTKE